MGKKIELLAPAGDFASLKAAIAAGADAVYLGGNAFSARAFAKNFSREELKEAVSYAHLRGVKIHVTCNILYRDDELKELMDYIRYLYEIQVDAILIQDIGVLKLVRKMYPDFEVHVSTQMTLTSLAAVRSFAKLGVSRVVLAREASLETIRHIIKNTSVEVEVFAHGAICVAYSGQCLMSSMIGGRSGNRGACAQPCRLPYTLKEDGQILNEKPLYMISPRDLCTIDHIGDFIKAGVTSLKIEGRMKKPEYVAAVVKSYRKAIDHYYNHHLPAIDDDDINDMKQMFNRHYTPGYAFHATHIVDGDFAGNRGMPLGKVIGYSASRKTVRIRLTARLNQGDSILFVDKDEGRPVNKIYKNGKLVNHGDCDDVVEVEFNDRITSGEVRKTVSAELVDRLARETKQKKSYRRMDMQVYAYIGAPLTVMATVDHHEVEITLKEPIEEAVSSETNADRIVRQLSKLGNSIYAAGRIDVYCSEHINIPISLLNEARREIIAQMDAFFSEQKIHHEQQRDVVIQEISEHQSHRMLAVVHTLRQLDEALDVLDDVYYYNDEGFDEAAEIYRRHQKDVRIYLPRITLDDELDELSERYRDVHHFIVNDYGAYELFKREDVIIGSGFNIYNHVSAAAFDESVIASFECTPEAISKMIPYNKEIILPIYGKVENMISEHCAVSQFYYHKKVPHCHRCKGHTYQLADRRHVAFTLMTDDHCRNHILNSVPLYIREYRQYPCSYLMMFTDEEDIAALLKEIQLSNDLMRDDGQKLLVTRGYFK